MADKDFTIDINLDSNAKGAAQDLTQVISAINKVTDAENRHNENATKNAQSQIKINREMLDVLKKIRDLSEKISVNTQKDQREKSTEDKRELDTNSKKLWQLSKMVVAYRAIKMVAHTAANVVKQFAGYGFAAGAVGQGGVTATKIGTLQYASELYGGTMQSAASDYTALRRLSSQYYIGRQLPIMEALARIPGLERAVINSKTGRWESNPDKMLENLNRLFQRLSKEEQFYVGESMGLSASTIQALALSPEKYKAEMEKAAKLAKERHEKELEDRENYREMLKFQRYLSDNVKTLIDPALKAFSSLPEEVKRISAALAVGGVIGMSLGKISRSHILGATVAAGAVLAKLINDGALDPLWKKDINQKEMVQKVSKINGKPYWTLRYPYQSNVPKHLLDELEDIRKRFPGISTPKAIDELFMFNQLDPEVIKMIQRQKTGGDAQRIQIENKMLERRMLMNGMNFGAFTSGDININVSSVPGDGQEIGQEVGRELLAYLDRYFAPTFNS